jgi:hypothetical protein
VFVVAEADSARVGSMLFSWILLIVALTLLIAAFALQQSRPNPVRPRRLVHYGVGLSVITAVCFLPAFLLIWVVDSYVIPIPMAIDAVWRFDPDPAKFEDSLENGEGGDIPLEHTKVLQNHGVPEDAIRGIQEMLWTGWPIIVGATLLFLLIGIQALAHCSVAFLRDVEANDTCPPGEAFRYVGVKTFDSPREYERDVLSGERREARSHSRRRLGNRSSHEIHQRDGLYEQIAVASDDFARPILLSIVERGPARVIERLAEDFHEPGHHEIRESPSGIPAHDDEAYEEGGYVLIWNTRRCYVSLACAVEPDVRLNS